MIVLVDDPSRTAALQGWFGRLLLVLAIWSIRPISHTLWPAKPKPHDSAPRPEEHAAQR